MGFYQPISKRTLNDIPPKIYEVLSSQKKDIDNYLQGNLNANEIVNACYLGLGKLHVALSEYAYRDFTIQSFNSVDIEKRNIEIEAVTYAIERWYQDLFRNYSLEENLNTETRWKKTNIARRSVAILKLRSSSIFATDRHFKIFDPGYYSMLGSNGYEAPKFWIHNLLKEGQTKIIAKFKKNFYQDVELYRRSLPKQNIAPIKYK